jgi:hypothetical protein
MYDHRKTVCIIDVICCSSLLVMRPNSDRWETGPVALNDPCTTLCVVSGLIIAATLTSNASAGALTVLRPVPGARAGRDAAWESLSVCIVCPLSTPCYAISRVPKTTSFVAGRIGGIFVCTLDPASGSIQVPRKINQHHTYL